MRKEIFDVVAQALKIPLSMMYGNITNMNEVVKVYLSICIDPLADMIGEESTRKYFTFDEWKNGCSVEVDTSCINHIDILEVADKVDKAISSGAASIDEIRKRLGWKPLMTEFSQAHWMTKNYALAEDMMNNAEGRENV
jgi:HK97 family phage portal protein